MMNCDLLYMDFYMNANRDVYVEFIALLGAE